MAEHDAHTHVAAKAGSGSGLRVKATLIHFLASVAFAMLAATVVFFTWFPDGLSDLMRGGELFWLVVGCDVVLGPLLSFVICSPTKSRRMLVLDYAVIVALQLSALAYGLSVVAASRPVFVVFSIDRLDVVSAFEVDTVEPPNAAALRNFPVSWTGPRMVALKLPTDTQGRNEALTFELNGGELQTQPRYFAPFSSEAALARAQSLDGLRTTHPQLADQAIAAAAAAGLRPDAVAWLPVRSRFGFNTAVLRRADASVVVYLVADAQ